MWKWGVSSPAATNLSCFFFMQSRFHCQTLWNRCECHVSSEMKLKTDVPCHTRGSMRKNPHCSMTMSTEYWYEDSLQLFISDKFSRGIKISNKQTIWLEFKKSYSKVEHFQVVVLIHQLWQQSFFLYGSRDVIKLENQGLCP